MRELSNKLGHCVTNAQKAERLLTSGLSESDLTLVKRQLSDLTNDAEKMDLRLTDLLSKYKEADRPAKMLLWERKLLDLTLRNNLLNMRYGKSVVPFPINPEDGCDDICSLEDELDRGKEFVLEQKELKDLYRSARTNMEETGANTLFVALGILQWKETSNGKFYASPILLIPVEMVPIKGNRYAIRKRDDETRLNMALIEFLKQKYDILVEGLQPLPQDAHGVDVSMVLHQVRTAVADHEEWHVDEDAALGLFSFTKFVMWNDVHAHCHEMIAHPLVKSIIEGKLLLNDIDHVVTPEEIDVDMRPEKLVMPLDGDSAQVGAVVDGMNGRSFCLYGPPGTGKSQSITNMIANGLYQNKRILFVAQKRAALEVVEHRLEKIGLGQFNLELHSNKADKKTFLAQLQRIIENCNPDAATDFHEKSEDLFAKRMKLYSFMEAMHRQRADGNSLYSNINSYLALDGESINLDKDYVKKHDVTVEKDLYEKLLLLESGAKKLAVPVTEHPLRDLIPVEESDKSPLLRAYSANKGLEEVIPDLPSLLDGVQRQLESNFNVNFSHKTFRQLIEGDYNWKKFLQLAQVDDKLYEDINLMKDAVSRWKSNLDLLPQWKQYISNFNELRKAGLSAAVAVFINTGSGQKAANAFIKGYMYRKIIDIIDSEAVLKDFEGASFEQLIQNYSKTVSDFQKLTRHHLTTLMMKRVSDICKDPKLSAELTLLRKRIATKGRGASIRTIIEQMPNLLSVLCPCMLMSPLSVAQYLSMDGDKFDLAIFDEASQLPTCEAVGSIARAKAAIVVGDPKQMPPTSFFSADIFDEDHVDDNDLESILDDCISLSMPARQLKWHYRSNHESLIAFSNQNYYDNQLVTFPSAEEKASHVQFHYVDGVYDFGKNRTNNAEAEAVVEETIRRMSSDGLKRSIGIVSFNKNQADLIEDILNERLAANPELMQLNRQAKESIFIKNLENVQGDERDIILFSVGYGPDAEGKISMNFGPLNQAGGERRLNVALSRSRYEMHIYSSLKPEQIDLRRTNAEGVIGLRKFMEFAQSNISCNKKEAQSNVDNMVQQIANRLEQCGYQTNIQIGSSAFKVDIGIIDPLHPERFKLGIVCDGNRYRQLKTVDDKEITCVSVLRRLSWNIMHVWVLDWLTQPDAVIKNILEQLK